MEITAPDPSIGNSKALFGMRLSDEHTMCAKLSPPGLDSKTMKELADATLDVIPLSGTSNTEVTDTSDLIDAAFAVYDVPMSRGGKREKSLFTWDGAILRERVICSHFLHPPILAALDKDNEEEICVWHKNSIFGRNILYKRFIP